MYCYQRYKDNFYLDASTSGTVKEQVFELLSERLNGAKPVTRSGSASSTTSANESSEAMGLEAMMKSIISKKKPKVKKTCSQDQAICQMIEDYANKPVVNNCFDYWREMAKGDRMQSEFARLARRFLTPPATTVDVERLFSTAGSILTDKRNRLKGDNLEKLLFCRETLAKLDFKY